MPDDFDLTPDDEFEDEPTDEVEDSEDTDEQSGELDKLAQFEERLAAIEGQSTKLVRDFSSAVGRVQSLVDRLESGRQVDAERFKTQLNTAVGSVEQQLDTILASDMVDPELRAKAQQARDRLRAETEQASLKAEMAALRAAVTTQRQAPDPNQLSPIEVNVHTMIADAGLKIDDFDWDEANTVYGTRGEPGVYAYFTNKIAERKTEATAADRRQSKKVSAGKQPQGSQAGAGDLAARMEHALDTGNLDDGVAILKSLGVNI